MLTIYTNEKNTITLLFVYCEGKSELWRMFFGLRSIDKNGYYTFKISKKAWKELNDIEANFS